MRSIEPQESRCHGMLGLYLGGIGRDAALLLILLFVPITSTHALEENRFTTLSAEAANNDYLVILRRVFHRLYSPEIVVSELNAVGRSNIQETATGVLRTSKGYEAFALFATASVWETELPRFLRGVQEYCSDSTGKIIPCPTPGARTFKTKTYRDIKTIKKTKALSADLASRIEAVWRQKVRRAESLPPLSQRDIAFGGSEHYYSVLHSDGRWVTILGQDNLRSPETGRMANLTDALIEYVKGDVSEAQLVKALEAVERNPTPRSR